MINPTPIQDPLAKGFDKTPRQDPLAKGFDKDLYKIF